MNARLSRLMTIVALALNLAGFSSPSLGAGFALIEQSVRGLGNAYSGGAAAAEDASTVFYNPAGMTRLTKPEFIVGSHVVVPSAKFTDEGSFLNPVVTGGTPVARTLTGGSGGDGGEVGVVPNLYYVHPLSSSLTAGIGVNAPFGLATKYRDGWVGRYHGLETNFRTININPSLAFKIHEKLSVGLGVSALYADLVEYSNAVDSGTICLSLAPAACALLPVANSATDSRSKLEGDDWGFGFNLGLLFEPTLQTRFGLAYRSKIDIEVEGDADFTVNPSLASVVSSLPGGLSALFTDTRFKARVSLPESVSASAYHQLNDKLGLMADVTWTRWSRFSVLRATFDNPVQPDLVQPENWKDNYRVSLGASYAYNPRWTLRAGVAYDEGAVQNARDRSPRIPDNDRTWIALGATYALRDRLALDVAYAHLFIRDGSTRFTDPTTSHVLVGSFDTEVDIISAQLSWVFD